MAKNVTLDTRQFMAGLERLASSVDTRATMVLGLVGNAVVSDMQSKAPVGTGRLRDSIRAETGRDMLGSYVDVSVEPFYASFKEWGTSRNGAHPFFRPGLERAGSVLATHAAKLLK